MSEQVTTLLPIDSLTHWETSIKAWVEETFGPAEPWSLDRAIEHLREEVEELAESKDPEELADVFILCFGIAQRMGIELAPQASAKFAKIQRRVWVPTPDGYRKHVKGIHD